MKVIPHQLWKNFWLLWNFPNPLLILHLKFCLPKLYPRWKKFLFIQIKIKFLFHIINEISIFQMNEMVKHVTSPPLFTGVLNEKQWLSLAKINDQLHEEYKIRREMILKRLDVTIQSFQVFFVFIFVVKKPAKLPVVYFCFDHRLDYFWF